MLALSQVEIARGGQTRARVEAWSLAAGETALLIGPSGAGKTTLLYAIAGLLPLTAGEIRVAERDVASLKGAALDRFRGATMGIVFQTLRLVQALSLFDNLSLALSLAGQRRDARRIQEALDRLGLSALGKRRPRELSVGEQQRAAIARAVIAQPKLILADEPTSALDDGNAEKAFSLLRSEAQACGAALLIATHDGRLIARDLPRLTLSTPA